MIALLLAALLAATGIPRIESPTLTALAEVRAQEVSVVWGHRYLSELNNGQWSGWGENIASCTNCTESEVVSFAVNGWNNSPTHHAIMFSTYYTHIGCGNYYNGADKWYTVCIWAKTSTSLPPPPAQPPSGNHPPIADQIPDTSVPEPKELVDAFSPRIKPRNDLEEYQDRVEGRKAKGSGDCDSP